MNKLIKTLNKRQLLTLLVLISYLLQGVASLIYQVSWEQATERIVGMALPTMAIVTSMFLFGMGLGAYLFSKILLKQEWAGRLFVINQSLLFLFGLIFTAGRQLNFFSNLTANTEAEFPLIYALRLVFVCLFVFIPAIFIGAGFPLLRRLSMISCLNNNSEKLYLSNIFGSMAGAILVGFILLPNLGECKSVICAAVINLAAALIVLMVDKFASLTSFSRTVKSFSTDNISLQTTLAVHRADKALSLLVIFCPAFFNMLLELLFVRLYILFMGCTAFAFSLVLAVQLFALACAAFVGVFYKIKDKNHWRLFAGLHLFAAIFLLVELYFLPEIPFFIRAQKHLWQTVFCLSPFQAFCLSNAIALLFTMFVPAFCLGANLPFYFRLRKIDSLKAAIGSSYAYAFNLFASVAGCLTGGIVVIPCLSEVSHHALYLALTLSAMAILFIGLLIYGLSEAINQNERWKNLKTFAIWLIVVMLVIILKPAWKQPLVENRNRLIFYKEGLNSTVSLTKNINDNVVYLQTDGQTEATLPVDPKLRAPFSDKSTQTLLGLLPILFCPRQMENVFLLGLGSGLTAKTILISSQVQKLTIAELEPGIINAAHYLELNHYLDSISLLDKRVQIKIADGRDRLSILNNLYDVIVSQPGEPWRSSSRYLYTLEFWQLVKSRLQPNGIFCQWLPLYCVDEGNLVSLCQTFANVFPDTFIVRSKNAGELILLAINSKDTQLIIDQQTKQTKGSIMQMPAKEIICLRSQLPGMKQALAQIGIYNLSQLEDMFSMNPKEFRDWLSFYRNKLHHRVLLNRDDFPYVQYTLQSLLINHGANINIDIEKVLPITRKNNPIVNYLKKMPNKSFNLLFNRCLAN